MLVGCVSPEISIEVEGRTAFAAYKPSVVPAIDMVLKVAACGENLLAVCAWMCGGNGGRCFFRDVELETIFAGYDLSFVGSGDVVLQFVNAIELSLATRDLA